MHAKILVAKDFLTLQEERVRTYKKLDDSHKVYMATAPDYAIEPYQAAVAEATSTFKAVSGRWRDHYESIFCSCKQESIVIYLWFFTEKVIEMKKKFEGDSDYNDPELAKCLGNVQSLEELKLRLTVDLQLAVQQAKDEPDEELEDLMDKNVNGIRRKLGDIVDEINENLTEIRYHIHELKEDE